MKKIFIFTLFLFCLFNFSIIAHADEIKIFNDCKEIKLDVSPTISENRTLVPIRALEQLGYTVQWDDTNKIVTLSENSIFKNKNRILLKINSTIIKNVSPNNEITTEMIDVAPQIRNNRTLVPLRFLSEKVGIPVFWDEIQQDVYLNKTKEECKLLLTPNNERIKEFIRRVDLTNEISASSENFQILYQRYNDEYAYEEIKIVGNDTHIKYETNYEQKIYVGKKLTEHIEYEEYTPLVKDMSEIYFRTNFSSYIDTLTENIEFNVMYEYPIEQNYSFIIHSENGKDISDITFVNSILEEDFYNYLESYNLMLQMQTTIIGAMTDTPIEAKFFNLKDFQIQQGKVINVFTTYTPGNHVKTIE